MAENHLSIEIQEYYKGYKPPININRIIKRLLSSIPPQRLTGLRYIILTNYKGLAHKSRRSKTWARKRKVPLSKCNGWYNQKWRGQPANIEILIDNILASWPRWLLNFSFIQDIAISETLFHEIGHHIHKTQAPEYEEREDVAEKWASRLSKRYFWKRYWYILSLLYPFKSIIRWLSKYAERKSNLRHMSD